MTILQSLRRRVLTPNVKQTRMDVRGFHVKSLEAADRLETVGRCFLTGYAIAAEVVAPADADARLVDVPHAYRGFAYEGAAMAFAVRDGLPVGGDRHVEEFLAGPGRRPHLHGVRRGRLGHGTSAAVPLGSLHAPDPLLRWLVLDGYGFHQAYFKTRQYVRPVLQSRTFPWPADGPSWYADRVIDQGVGRAMWFVGGTDPRRVVAASIGSPSAGEPICTPVRGWPRPTPAAADEAELAWFRDAAGVYAGASRRVRRSRPRLGSGPDSSSRTTRSRPRCSAVSRRPRRPR